MADDNNNVYAPTEVRVADVVVEGDLDLASRASRLGATLLDVLMIAGIGIIAAIAIPSIAQGSEGASMAAISLMGVLFVALAAANVYFVYKNGQTLGKKALSIKVVRSNGERASFPRIFFMRYLSVTLLGAIPLVGYIISLVDALLIFRQSQKCLHDDIADTVVIKA
jgi:uncharacterized RDD family membrane protein YckC